MNSPHIMIVDDTPENLHLLSNLLNKANYRVSAFPHGTLALRAARQRQPDLILLDITMPGMDGYEVCAQLKADQALRDIPIIFISALGDTLDKTRAFQAGGVDYITKPFQVEEVHARVTTHLELRRSQKQLESANFCLEQQVAEQLEEINRSQRAMIFALAKLSHMRDDDTGLHLERVQDLCRVLAQKLASDSKYAHLITDDFIETIYQASPLHDVGKVGINDEIMLKPGKLTVEEFDVMRTHTSLGAATLEFVYAKYPHNDFVRMGIDIAKYHHERWDGKGYPCGLTGEEIPLSARIMALVDVYEALRSKRPYKEPFSHQKAKQIILDGSGSNFDPQVVQAFCSVDAEFDQIQATSSEGVIPAFTDYLQS
ncbi:two-component system response regulator [Syntrophotalea acetylenivorans]|uniref:Two-component system response regulator n=1 Tax=Syntrophotalea acetylenivorans TaxID=1842532 RepID=A0A1L3GLL8_9BACT|nr:response regulator [Syntrophotalea acetylenivorans]APG26558.1 two-component system response regulator [Syntrophotalea acetylenivorans]